MSIAEKLATIADNEQKIYDAGVAKCWDDFWEQFQDGGNRTGYDYAFRRWRAEYIRPKYKVVPTGTNNTYFFENCRNLKIVESAYFDMSQMLIGNGVYDEHDCVFRYCYELLEVEDIGMKSGGYEQTWRYCEKLKKIAVMRVNTESTFRHVFTDCYALEDITIDGVIGQNGLDLHWSTKLTADSIRSLINALSAETTGLTVTLSQAAREAAFTDEEWAALIATKTNWTISLI